MHPRPFLTALRAIERAPSAAALGRLRATFLERFDVITPDARTRHVFVRLMQRERDLVAVGALIASLAAGDARGGVADERPGTPAAARRRASPSRRRPREGRRRLVKPMPEGPLRSPPRRRTAA